MLLKCKHYNHFETLRNRYINLKGEGEKKWIDRNGDELLISIVVFLKELRKSYLSRQVDELIRYLGCSCELNVHIDVISEKVRTVVSIMMLSNHHEKDLVDIFDRIFACDIKNFPFPSSFKVASDEVKKEYLDTITLKEQIQSIKTIISQPNRLKYFVFRCLGINATATLSMEYGDVHFVNGNHRLIKQLKKALILSREDAKFFIKEDCIYAIVRTRSNSLNSGVKVAIAKSRDAVTHLRTIIGDGFSFDSMNYLVSSDFKYVGWNFRTGDGVLRITDYDLDHYSSTSFAMLKNVKGQAKDDFLQHEILFSRATHSLLMHEYWIYAEVMLGGLPAKQGIERLAKVCSIGQREEILHLLLSRMDVITHPINTSSADLGIPWELQKELNGLANEIDLRIKWYEVNVHVPIIERLVLYARDIQRKSVDELIKENQRLWIRAYGHRNSIIHSNLRHDKSIAVLMTDLPYQVRRFRIAVLNKLLKEPKHSLKEIVADL
ncbi:MAG: hypothetical protein WAS33_16520 [Candidatus Promineifilaceae bacterium]